MIVTKNIQKEFERCVRETGLEICDRRGGGLLITGWGNDGKSIPKTLTEAGLPYKEVGRGGYMVHVNAFARNTPE